MAFLGGKEQQHSPHPQTDGICSYRADSRALKNVRQNTDGKLRARRHGDEPLERFIAGVHTKKHSPLWVELLFIIFFPARGTRSLLFPPSVTGRKSKPKRDPQPQLQPLLDDAGVKHTQIPPVSVRTYVGGHDATATVSSAGCNP